MNASEVAVVVALLAGSLRAVQVWRKAARVDVVNVVVLNTVASGKVRDLPALLRSSGQRGYSEVALAVAESAMRLVVQSQSGGDAPGHDRRMPTLPEARAILEHEAVRAVIPAVRRTWSDTVLDAVVLLGLVFAGVNAAVGNQASVAIAAGLLAATLLWISNVSGSRANATRIYAGAMALADSMVRFLDTVPSPAEPAADRTTPVRTSKQND